MGADEILNTMLEHLEKWGMILSATGQLGWGWAGLIITWEQGEGLFSLRIRDRSLLRRSISRSEEGGLTEKIAPFGERTGLSLSALVCDLPHLLGYLVHHLRFRLFACDVRLGCSSAPLTGMIYGYFQAVRGILFPVSGVSLSMTPDFDRTVLEGKGEILLEIRYPFLLGFRVLPPVIRAMRGKR
jgi:hypothetical protein